MNPTELKELLERLRNFSPPDRTVDELRPASQAIFDAASALEAMGAELADKDTVPRTRYNVLNDQWLDARKERDQYRTALVVTGEERDALRLQVEAARAQAAQYREACEEWKQLASANIPGFDAAYNSAQALMDAALTPSGAE